MRWDAYRKAIVGRLRETGFREVYGGIERQAPSRTTDWVQGLCPFHADTEPSFGFNTETGRFHCFVCADGDGSCFDFVMKAEGVDLVAAQKLLGERCGVPVPEPTGAHTHGANGTRGTGGAGLKEVEAYLYHDASGELSYEVVRFVDGSGSKTFRCRQPLPSGGHRWGLKGKTPLPYRLPKLLEAIEAGDPVVVVEGERDVRTVEQLGWTATTNHGGASRGKPKWTEKHSKWFPERALVYVIGDRDVPGNAHANAVAASLAARGCRVQMVDLGYPLAEDHGKDVSDWVLDGRKTADDFQALLDAATDWEGPADGTSPTALHPLTDAGLAERYEDAFGTVIRYVDQWKRWLVYDSARWAMDERHEVLGLAIEVARKIPEEARFVADADELKAIIRFAKSAESAARVNAALSFGRNKMAAVPDEFDRDPMALNLRNGTFDLTRGVLRPHKAADYLMKLAPVEYLPEARCPLWQKFVAEIMCDDLGLVDFLQRAIGYALSGDMREQVLFIMYGTGENGKTTFIETIHALLGDYALSTPAYTFLDRRDDGGPSEELARLKGVRFVTASEFGEGKALNEPLIKGVTGGDRQSARFAYGHLFDFWPQYKLFLATNKKPVIRGSDRGIWRRIRLIPFTASFPEGDPRRDPDLKDKLRGELPGILNWAIDGFERWQEKGLDTPDAVRAATAEYQHDMDVITQFVEECCEVRTGPASEHPDGAPTTTELYGRYQVWSSGSGQRQLGMRTFSARLEEHGFSKVKGRRGRAWPALRLLDDLGGGSSADGVLL